MADTYDVVVVGGRVAGASTAMLLARAGARVAVVERSAHGSDTISTHSLMRAGVLQLSRWGVLRDIVRAGTPPVRRTLFHYGWERPVQVSIRQSPGVDALYAPRRWLIDRVLVDAAADAGAEVMHGVSATGLLGGAAGRVGGVRVTHRDGRVRDLRGRVTVGADGNRSVVADGVHAPVQRTAAASSAVLYGYYEDFPVDGYEFAYGDGASAGMMPTNDGQTCAFVATTPGRLRGLRRPGTDTAFTELFAAAAPRHRGRLDRASRTGRLRGWSGVPGYVRRSGGPGWALVGDAGYFKDPVTAHGMTDALRDSELLADALLDGLSGAADEADALALYQSRRDRLSLPLFESTGRIASFDWDLGQVQQLVREASAAMTDEVEVLQALGERRDGPGPAAFIPPDSLVARG